ncbi:MAG: methionyl-tRNA formyltransferase [Polyangiales bacterium]
MHGATSRFASVFFGTPDFACPSLHALTRLSEVRAVVTQPDRRQGRGQRLAAPPVKRLAEALGLPVWQPERPRGDAFLAELHALEPVVCVVVAYGHILTAPVLEAAPKGCVNVHASLLPRWRGAAPIQHALLAGDEVTGVSLMCLDRGMDTGPVLAQRRCTIGADDGAPALGERLAELGGQILVEALPAYVAGQLHPQAQPETGISYAPKLHKDDGQLDWSQSSTLLYNRFRAMGSWPGVFTTWQGQRLRLLELTQVHKAATAAPGTVFAHEQDVLLVACGNGALALRTLQLAGRKACNAAAFVHGHKNVLGTALGASETR